MKVIVSPMMALHRCDRSERAKRTLDIVIFRFDLASSKSACGAVKRGVVGAH